LFSLGFCQIDIVTDFITILFSIIVVTVGFFIHPASKKLVETLGKNIGNIVAVAALTDTALNIYNTIQNNKDSKGGGFSSPENSDDSSKDKEDESSKDKDKSKDQVKKDNPSVTAVREFRF
jgi:hypothetical protein